MKEPRVGPLDRRVGSAWNGTRRFRRSWDRRSIPITEGDAVAATSVREGRYRRTLAAVDALVAAAVVTLGTALSPGPVEPLAALAAPVLMIALNRMMGLYERDELVLNRTTLDEAPGLLQSAAVFTLLVWLLLASLAGEELSAGAVATMWSATFALLVVGRLAGRACVRRSAPEERCLVIGEESSIAAIRSKITAGAVNAQVVASLQLDGFPAFSGDELAKRFRALVRREDVHRAIIAPASDGASGELVDLIRTAKHAGVRVSLVPRMLEVVGSAVEFDHMDGLTMLGVRRFGLSRSSRLLKRSFDLAGSSVMLVAVAPVMLAIMVVIRLDSPGPLLFRQTRVGKDGQHFELLKFRSMVVGADAQKEALRDRNETQGLFKIEADPRVTRVGRFLRSSCLDELPQLVNVWRGEMSLVGPRPLVVDEDAQVVGLDRYRLHLTPGMTGHWQILGCPRVPMHEMVGIDYLYVANWSLWQDVKILLRTIPYMLGGRGW